MPKVKLPKPPPDYQKIYQLAAHYSEASRLLEEQAKGEEWGCSASQLLVDSFAVELYLKCLFVVDAQIRTEDRLRKVVERLDQGSS